MVTLHQQLEPKYANIHSASASAHAVLYAFAVTSSAGGALLVRLPLLTATALHASQSFSWYRMVRHMEW